MKNSLFSLLLAVIVASNVHAQCSAPTGLTTSYSSNVTSFNWSAVSGATSYVFEAKQAWDDWAYAEVLDTVSTNSYSLTGIMHSLSIDWRVKTICASGVSAYQSTSFTLPCPQPSSLTTSSVTMTSATIGWTAAAGYNTYVSDFTTSYRKSGVSTWTYLGNTSATSKSMTGLLANTTYEWRVAQTCPYSNSTYVTSSFTTAACNSYGANSTEWISRFKIGTTDRSSSAESGGYVNTGISTNLAVGSSNTAKIRVGYSGSFTDKVFKVYIDYNNNTIYEETEVAYGPANITSGGLQTFTLNVSSTASTGSRGMRVIMARTGTSITGCMTGFNGETEDYKVNLTSSGHKGVFAATDESEAERINIFPNPAASNLKIELPDGVSTINVYDIMGQRVYQQQVSSATMDINVAEWPTAQYIVEAIYADGHKDITRFMKQ